MRKVIVNSTPLIVLCKIGSIHILKDLYEEILIPEAVYNEVTAKKDSACLQLKQNDWIKIVKIPKNEKLKIYRARLHSGEVEVMLLAQKEPKADLIIMDDNAAKTTAKFLGLNVTGTLGVLLKAKKLGIINKVKPIIDRMKNIGFYISSEVESFVLELSNEQ